MDNEGKYNIRIYIIMILCILILVMSIFKINLPKNTSSIESQDEDVFKFKYNISKVILPDEITWLKYLEEYTKSEGASEKNLNLAFSIFELNEESVIKSENAIEEKNEFILYDSILKKTLDINNPEVLIYSTHTTESYSDVSPDGDTYDKQYNVSGLGELLAKNLEENYGIATKHNDTVHNDIYMGSYDESRETLENELANYPDYKLIIDLHRDSVGDNKGLVTTLINGETVARFMLVDDSSVETIYENQKIMNELASISNILYPGLYRGIYSYKSGSRHFNLDINTNIIIIELGASCNTYEEARGTIKYLADIIAIYLNKN